MADLRRAAEANPNYPAILFFHQSTVPDGEAFFSTQWPHAAAIADPEQRFYRALGVTRGHLSQLVSPAVVACSIRAVTKGNFAGRTQGDPRLLPGLFLVHGTTIIWQHDYKHVGDHPDFAAIAEILADPTTLLPSALSHNQA